MFISRILTVLVSLTFARRAIAVYADEAFHTDWLLQQIGILSQDATAISSDGQFIASYTKANLLSVLNASDGSVVWRRELDIKDTDKEAFLVSHGKTFIVGLTSDQTRHMTRLSSWDLESGLVVWDITLDTKLVLLKYLEPIGQYAAAFEDGSVLLNDGRSADARAIQIPDPEARIVDVNLIDSEIAIVAVRKHRIHLYVYSDEQTPIWTYQVKLEPGAVYLGSVQTPDSPASIYWANPSNLYAIRLETGISDPVSHYFENHPSFQLTKEGIVVASDSETQLFNLFSSGLESQPLAAPGSGDILSSGNVIVQITDTGVSWSTPEGLTVAELSHSGEVLSRYLVSRPDDQDRPGVLVQYSNGLLIYFEGSNVSWKREEALSEVVEAAFIDLPTVSAGLSADELLFEESTDLVSAYLDRFYRHWKDLVRVVLHLNQYPLLSDNESDLQEIFGFNKLLITATKTGRLVALEALTGHVAWALDGFTDVIEILPTGNNNILVAQYSGEVTVLDTKGHIVREAQTQGESLQRVLSTGDGQMIGWDLDDTVTRIDISEPRYSNQVQYLVKTTTSAIYGYVYNPDLGDKLLPSWTFKPGPAIVSTARKHTDDISASVGTILGDGKVLYKYLHPNALAVATLDATKLVVYLIDVVNGRILHSKVHMDSIDANAGLHLVQGENWVVYSYFSQQPVVGQKIVVWDLFESEIPDVRWSSDNQNISAFEDCPLPYVQAQSFISPHKITALAISRTRFGITLRDIIASLSSGQIVEYPKRILEPRRPVGREPTKQEASEGLKTYDPYIGLDPRLVISHSQQVLGINHIITEPTTLESTSLIAAYGFDIFFTRVTPSHPFDMLNSNFAKTKLVITIAALLAILLVLRPLVQRRVLNLKWGAS